MDHGLQSVQATQGEGSNPNDRLTASFGILIDEPYDPSRHKGERRERHPVDGRQYARHQVRWVLTQGQTVPKAGVQYQFHRPIYSENLEKPRRIYVFTSDLPTSKLPPSLKHDGVRIFFHVEFKPDLLFDVEFKPDFKAMGGISRLKNNLFYPRKPKFITFKCFFHFKIDPLTKRLSVTPLYQDGTPIPGSRTIWRDPNNLDDGCSAISIPPPMYCLTRPESTEASLFERFAKEGSQNDNGGEEGEN